MNLATIILGSIAYCLMLIVVAYRWVQYIIRVRRCWWIPFPTLLIGMGVMLAWQYLFEMPFDSNLIEVAMIGVTLSLASFLVLSGIGWWCWARSRFTDRST